jgi:AmpD protein
MATRTDRATSSSGPPPELKLPWPEVDPATHRLRGVRFVASPNCDARPDPSDISLLVLHNISLPPGEFGGGYVEQLFANRLDWNAHPYFATIRDLKVSAHAFIDRAGAVTQFVPFDRRAWHAGQSSFEGRERCNDFSIGIELEGADDRAFTEAQYVQLSRVARALMRAYPKITRDRITGHSDVAPGRKTDPGPRFDWQSFLLRLEYQR